MRFWKSCSLCTAWIIFYYSLLCLANHIIFKRSAKLQKYSRLHGFKTTSRESKIALELYFNEDLSTKFSDIGGLDDLKEKIMRNILLPIQHELLKKFSNSSSIQKSLIQAPAGILLHGPPGCGKTMLCMATAKEASSSLDSLTINRFWWPSSVITELFDNFNEILSLIKSFFFQFFIFTEALCWAHSIGSKFRLIRIRAKVFL